MENKIVLIDSYSLLYRAYYAIRTPMNAKDGTPTGAVFGFTNMLLKIIDEYKPTHVFSAFDVHAPTFRHKACDYYKATRKPMPEDLRPQVPLVRELLTAMNVTIVEKEGYEGDDILGSLSRKLEGQKYIVTGDRDSLQLISEDTTVLLTKQGISEVVEYTPEKLREEGLEPYQIIELKALMGDSSDNIKGIQGVGEKTAKDLISKYNDIDNLYLHKDEIAGKLGEKVRAGEEDARQSKFLATIVCDAPIDISLKKEQFSPFNQRAKEVFEKLEFKSIIKRLNFDGTEEEKDQIKIEIEQVDTVQDALSVLGDEIGLHYSNNYIALSSSEQKEYRIPVRQTLLDDGVYLNEGLKEIAGAKKLVIPLAKNLMHLVDSGEIGEYFDVSLAGYLLNAKKSYEDIDELISDFAEVNFGECKACAIFSLKKVLENQLKQKGLDRLYYEVEKPLTKVLYEMEECGFCIDVQMLDDLGEKYSKEIDMLVSSIYELAGEEFNVNSSKQLANILYGKLGLPVSKKTKSGASTNAETLEKLIGKHEIIDFILRYRTLSKLKSTYVDGIKPLIDKKNNRLHTVFRQTATVTGRLSSTEPNLQNIPVRTAEGRELRKMFVASPKNLLVCADYSQIELRLLAEFSKDDKLVHAYKTGEDIHSATASAVYGVDISEVDKDMRSSAKAVNFGIIYGISDYGLATELKIAPRHAKAFIQRYFDSYPKVKDYMDQNVAFAKENGYAITHFGRIRAIPEINATNFNIRSFGERAAMNMPLQGTAADLIKIAMIKVSERLKKESLSAKLILQVHDELIIDSPESEVEIVKKILKEEMEGVANFTVPLIAEVGEGKDWYTAK